MVLSKSALNLFNHVSEIDDFAAKVWTDENGQAFRRRHLSPLSALLDAYYRDAQAFEKEADEILSQLP